MPRDSRYRDRRSSSYSSESSYDRKKSKSKYKRRSRSRDRSESSSHKRKHKRRSYSRSVSRDRYELKSRRRSRSRSKRERSRSASRPRSKRDRSISSSRSRSRRDRSVSSSRSRTKVKSKKSKRSRSSSDSSEEGTERVTHPKRYLDDTETKIEKAIKAAEAAGVTLTKIPTYEYKEVEIKEDMPTIHDRNLLADINSDGFVQRSFTSSKNKKQSQNIVIDLESQTVTVPELDVKKEDSIINFDELPSEEDLQEMWIKKLYLYRKKVLKEIHIG